MSDTTDRPIAYLTGEYPRATDTFIQREVAELRAMGQEVVTCSVRRTGDEHLVGEQMKHPSIEEPAVQVDGQLVLGMKQRVAALG